MKAGEAFSTASNQPATMEGAHADSMLYLFDEAKTIPDEIFNVADGATMSAGPETGKASRIGGSDMSPARKGSKPAGSRDSKSGSSGASGARSPLSL